jgi:hypothetical protein
MHQALGLCPGFVSEKVDLIKNDISIRNNGIVRDRYNRVQPTKGRQTENEKTSIKKRNIFTRAAKAKRRETSGA